jgi:hypothetical protein
VDAASTNGLARRLRLTSSPLLLRALLSCRRCIGMPSNSCHRGQLVSAPPATTLAMVEIHSTAQLGHHHAPVMV